MELQVPGATLNYETWGTSGPWITLINGHTRPLTDFKFLGKHLVEAGFRVLTWDNRGAGLTKESQPFSLDDMVEDARALIQHNNIDKSHLLGISMGGFIAQTLSKDSWVGSLTLVSTALKSEDIDPVASTPWPDSEDGIVEKLKTYFAEDFYQSNGLLVKAMAKQILKNMNDANFGERALMQKQAIGQFDGRRLINNQLPTLVIHGELDRIIPQEALNAFRDINAEARICLFENVGHLLLAESSGRLRQEVTEFLSSLAG